MNLFDRDDDNDIAKDIAQDLGEDLFGDVRLEDSMETLFKGFGARLEFADNLTELADSYDILFSALRKARATIQGEMSAEFAKRIYPLVIKSTLEGRDRSRRRAMAGFASTLPLLIGRGFKHHMSLESIDVLVGTAIRELASQARVFAEPSTHDTTQVEEEIARGVTKAIPIGLQGKTVSNYLKNLFTMMLIEEDNFGAGEIIFRAAQVVGPLKRVQWDGCTVSVDIELEGIDPAQKIPKTFQELHDDLAARYLAAHQTKADDNSEDEDTSPAGSDSDDDEALGAGEAFAKKCMADRRKYAKSQKLPKVAYDDERWETMDHQPVLCGNNHRYYDDCEKEADIGSLAQSIGPRNSTINIGFSSTASDKQLFRWWAGGKLTSDKVREGADDGDDALARFRTADGRSVVASEGVDSTRIRTADAVLLFASSLDEAKETISSVFQIDNGDLEMLKAYNVVNQKGFADVYVLVSDAPESSLEVVGEAGKIVAQVVPTPSDETSAKDLLRRILSGVPPKRPPSNGWDRAYN